MKRLYLSFAILALIACGGTEGDDLEGSGKPRKPGEPGKPRDVGAQLDDAGPGTRDGGTDAGALADGGPSPDGSARADSGPDAARDTGASSGGFEGTWQVILLVNEEATTCTNPLSFSTRIDDEWLFEGDTLTGDHLGPNPYYRQGGSDVWNTGETTIAATADLELIGGDLRGVFVFYRDLCDVFYDVAGERPQ